MRVSATLYVLRNWNRSHCIPIPCWLSRGRTPPTARCPPDSHARAERLSRSHADGKTDPAGNAFHSLPPPDPHWWRRWCEHWNFCPICHRSGDTASLVWHGVTSVGFLTQGCPPRPETACRLPLHRNTLSWYYPHPWTRPWRVRRKLMVQAL